MLRLGTLVAKVTEWFSKSYLYGRDSLLEGLVLEMLWFYHLRDVFLLNPNGMQVEMSLSYGRDLWLLPLMFGNQHGLVGSLEPGQY